MASRMIMSSHAGLTFMYRVGGIVIHENRLLVEALAKFGEAGGFLEERTDGG